MVNAVLWCLVGLGAVFVGLRVYTRIVILNSVGWDDHTIVLAWVRPALSCTAYSTYAFLTQCDRSYKSYIPL
jgi:hypothetical protein